jgi:uncharacterized protein YfaP (DUF2135 family)
VTIQYSFALGTTLTYKGAYDGRITSSSGGESAVIGLVSLKVADNGGLSGYLTTQGRKLAYRGKFNPDNQTGVIQLPNSAYSLQLEINTTTGRVTGSFSEATSVIGNITSERNVFNKLNPCPHSGQYTVVVQRDSVVNTNYTSAGYGTVKVDSAGKASLQLTLPDGGKVSNSVQLTSDGNWPLHIGVSRGKGLVSGLAKFSNEAAMTDVDGFLQWRPSNTSDLLSVAMIGSRFDKVSFAMKAVNFDNNQNNIHLSAFPSANAESLISHKITLGLKNKVAVPKGSSLRLSFNKSNGIFTASVPMPGQKVAAKMMGVILQRQNRGLGLLTSASAVGLAAIDRIVKIDIDSPLSGATISGNPTTISGRVSVQDEEMMVNCNGVTEKSNLSGGFTAEVSLFPGSNTIEVSTVTHGMYVSKTAVQVSSVLETEAAGIITSTGGGMVEVTDAASPLNGTRLTVAAGAISGDAMLDIISQPDDMPNLPYGTVQVGPSAIVYPIGQQFSPPAILRLRVNSALFPQGTDYSSLSVLVDGDDGWEYLPVVARTAGYVDVSVASFVYGDIVPIIDTPLALGDIRLVTIPAGATVYLDGFNTGLETPCVLSDVPEGQRNVKLHILGFNEMFETINMTTQGKHLSLPLTVPENPPNISLDSPIQDQMEANSTLFTVAGKALNGLTPVSSGHAVVILNGEDTEASLNADGTFSVVIALQPGLNTISCRVTDANGETGTTEPITVISTRAQSTGQNSQSIRSLRATSANQSVVATLTWNSNDTDVDFHITDEKGNHASYLNLSGMPGGLLDRDDTDEFGPEVFTMLNPTPGRYYIRVNYYSDHGNGPTNATLNVKIANELVFSGSMYLSNRQDWNAYDFTIDDLEIESIETHLKSPINKAIFTTLPSENEVKVTVKAADSIPDSAIKLRIREKTESYDVDTSAVTFANRVATVKLTKKAKTYTSAKGKPLQYEFIAFTEGGQESSPKLLIQDQRSQIRQEYVDKRELKNIFTVATPTRRSIIDGSQFYGPHYFRFADFARYSDFPQVAVISASKDIALQLGMNYPNNLRLTSGWRNPRRNDRIAGTVNSYHQTGSGVDFNPNRSGPWLPIGDDPAPTTYYEAQNALYKLAKRLFPSPTYDVLLHGNDLHVHIERNE